MGRANERRAAQLAFLENGHDLEVGNIRHLPIDVETLKHLDRHSRHVAQSIESGLTAEVFKLEIDGVCWTLKRKREESLVRNVDGQTSFLNEVQRRHDFERLKATEPESFKGIVDTTYASLKHGIILSPWIEGDRMSAFPKSALQDLFETLYHVETAGLFEYDLCPGNLLLQTDGTVKLFDFGYMYRYNPLCEFNADGTELPLFHGAERFETRCLMQHLMDTEESTGKAAALALYRMEKEVAMAAYRKKWEWLAAHHAEEEVIGWTAAWIDGWEKGLRSEAGLEDLYVQESFRSYVLDVEDDIGGKSCTPATVKKIIRILEMIQQMHALLRDAGSYFWGDEKLDQKSLLAKYGELESQVMTYQLR